MCSDLKFKTCTSCKKSLSLDCFGKKGIRSGKPYYDSKCKECRRGYFRKRYKKKSKTKSAVKDVELSFHVVSHPTPIPIERELRLLILKGLEKEKE